MTHLSPAEFVDAAEGTLPAARAAHLDACASCHAEAAAVAATLQRSRDSDVPEPSPLYWTHLSARVRERVADEPIVPAWRAEGWRGFLSARPLIPVASALVLAVAVVGGGMMMRHAGTGPLDPNTIAGAAPSDLALQPEEAAVWQVLATAASDMPIEDANAAGLAVPSAAIDDAVQRLTPDELRELNRLLQSELGGRGH